MNSKLLLAPLAAAVLATAPAAQGPVFSSPGGSTYQGTGQTSRFSREFNPAFGLVIDGYGDYLTAEGAPDGFDLSLRLFELSAAAWIDPSAWAWVVLGAEELDAPVVEEAAVEYVGDLFGGNSTAMVGRFFVDFGKQMQMHPEELRTLERPLVLREFLGEELAGVGLQFDNWFAAGDTTPVRYSVGVFSDLISEGHHQDEGSPIPEADVPERKSLDELSLAARLTGMTETGEQSTLQLGTSLRYAPEFSFEFGSLEQTGLSNLIWGVDATWGWADETGTERLTLGLEALRLDGDLSAAVDDPMTPTVLTVTNDAVHGYYVFGDWGWNRFQSAGLQYSWVESPDDPASDLSELDLYYTHHFTEFRRLRLGTTLADVDAGGDSFRVYVQFTGFLGAHSHGLNW